MTIKELKAIIGKLNKDTIVKVNGKDAKVEISVNQDSQWSLNFLTQETTIPAVSGDNGKLER